MKNMNQIGRGCFFEHEGVVGQVNDIPVDAEEHFAYSFIGSDMEYVRGPADTLVTERPDLDTTFRAMLAENILPDSEGEQSMKNFHQIGIGYFFEHEGVVGQVNAIPLDPDMEEGRAYSFMGADMEYVRLPADTLVTARPDLDTVFRKILAEEE